MIIRLRGRAKLREYFHFGFGLSFFFWFCNLYEMNMMMILWTSWTTNYCLNGAKGQSTKVQSSVPVSCDYDHRVSTFSSLLTCECCCRGRRRRQLVSRYFCHWSKEFKYYSYIWRNICPKIRLLFPKTIN